MSSAVLFVAPTAVPETIQIIPSADATLIEEPDGLRANGAGPGIYAGRTMQSSIRRALLRFDVAAAVPADATIQSAHLLLSMTKTRVENAPFELHRVLSSWTEGPAGGAGGGSLTQNGDVTWLHSSYPARFWVSPGGDFSEIVTADALVDSAGPYQWGPTPQMTADLQSWMVDPSSNHGWILIGDESGPVSTKQFDSRQGFFPALRPVLTITFAVAPCNPADVNCDMTVNGRDIPAFVNVVSIQAGCSTCAADMDGNANIDANDLGEFVAALLLN